MRRRKGYYKRKDEVKETEENILLNRKPFLSGSFLFSLRYVFVKIWSWDSSHLACPATKSSQIHMERFF